MTLSLLTTPASTVVGQLEALAKRVEESSSEAAAAEAPAEAPAP